MASADPKQAPFIKQLAGSGMFQSLSLIVDASFVPGFTFPRLTKIALGSDRATRDKALSSLRTYLSGRRTFDELELLKLWKGLFYCQYLCTCSLITCSRDEMKLSKKKQACG